MMNSIPFRSIVLISGLLLSDRCACRADQDQPNASRGSPTGTDAGKTSSVAAQVVDSNAPGRSQPERQAGAFTIPQGSLGVNLKYRYHDPSTDYSSTTLSGSNLYSVTENHYLRELEFVPIYKLPPGDYRFEVGGTPGANGVLTMTVVPGTPPAPTSRTGNESPGTPSTNSNPTKTSPPSTGVAPPGTQFDEETLTTMKALERGWSGIYTIDKVTGNVEGLGQVQGKRAFNVTFRRDERGVSASGAVWMPPGWFGNAGGGIVDPGKVVKFHVLSKQIKGGVHSIYYKGVYDPKTDSMKGTLIGYMPKGESSEPVFEGSWYLKPR